MQKKEFLEHLKALADKVASKLKFTPVQYGHKGSTYDECGIRITGSPEFIDSVLLKLGPAELLSHENLNTRLQVTYTEAKDRKTGDSLGTYVCYLQVWQRGEEAKAVNAFASAICKKQVIVSKGY